MSKLPIPAKALSQHVIALGKTRSGKSSKMRLIVEWLLDANEPVCIIDPKGDWWGLRSDASGKGRGYPVVIFGGEHADVPLNAHAGVPVAEIIATGNRPALIDLGGWMIAERTRFFIDFASTFFKLTRGARYLVIDEVHNFAPQIVRGGARDVDTGKMLHWANRLASEGSGKGVTLIAASQRPQKVSKDFVTSCETLIACRVIHPRDRQAIAEWIDGCADPEKGKEVLRELAQMERTDAWVWSPEIDFGPKRITWPMFSTYDSFKPQQAKRGRLKGWASVDLADVSSKLAGAIKEAQANDPMHLRAKILELQKELAKKPPPISAPRVDTKTLERAAEERGFNRGFEQGEKYKITDRNAEHKELRQALQRAIDTTMNEHAPQAYQPRKSIEPVKDLAAAIRQRLVRQPGENTASVAVTSGKLKHGAAVLGDGIAPGTRIVAGNGAEQELPSVRKILDTFHKSYPIWLTFEAAARRAGISSRSSAYGKYRKLIAESPELEGESGSERYRSFPQFAQAGGMTPGASISDWASKLPPTYGAMLRAIHERGPIDRATVAELAKVSPTSSGLVAGLGELVRLSLVIKEGAEYRVAEGLE